jgi:histidinol-phosphate aminotransferase
VILGCGSTEILRVACCAFLGPGKQLVQASPTFEAIEAYARVAGAQVASLPLNREFAHDLDGMLRRANEGTSLAYICNPNNPSGSLTFRKDLESFIARLSKNNYVLIDEAYHHYAGDGATYQSFLDHPVDDERAIVCRTFSKVYGLAGLRIGYGIAHPSAAKKMRTYLSEANINQFAVRAAVAAIEDTAGLQTSVKRNANDRQEFFNQAMARMLKPVDSHGNFVFMNVHHPAGEVIRHFQENNILIGRQFSPLDTYIRISLGLPSEMQAFWQVWDRLPFAIAPMSH